MTVATHSRQVIHGAERGETSALLLSPGRRSSLCAADPTPNESQFTYFLTAPLQAFIQLVGLSSDIDVDVRNNGETLLSSAFAEWEVILCTSNSLDLVWAQVIPDQFLRRLILRFIFCRAVLSLFSPSENDSRYLPDCLPDLPGSLSPASAATQSCVLQLAENFGVVHHFRRR